MKEQLVARMAQIVDEITEFHKTDFTNFDKEYMEHATSDCFPLIWIVRKSGTYLLTVGQDASQFSTDPSVLLSYIEQKGEMYSSYFVPFDKDDKGRIFLITEDAITEINYQQARNVIKDMFTPAVVKWEAEHGKLPKRTKVKVRFNGLTISKLKELFAEEERYGMQNLRDILHRFHRYSQYSLDDKVIITYNRYKELIVRRYVGGQEELYGEIVFHGWPETVYMQNGAYQSEPQYGWDLHT